MDSFESKINKDSLSLAKFRKVKKEIKILDVISVFFTEFKVDSVALGERLRLFGPKNNLTGSKHKNCKRIQEESKEFEVSEAIISELKAIISINQVITSSRGKIYHSRRRIAPSVVLSRTTDIRRPRRVNLSSDNKSELRFTLSGSFLFQEKFPYPSLNLNISDV